MTASSELVGAVLAGGESRRMGADKARLELDGATLGARAVGVLRQVLSDVVVVSRRLGDHSDLGVPELADRLPGLGPLSGLDAALDYGRGRGIFVLACDLPRVGPELILHLTEVARPALGARGGPGAVVPTVADRPQPLCGVYAASCHAEVRQRLAAGELRLLDLVASVGALCVELGAHLPFYRPDLLDNLNDRASAERLGVVVGER